MRAIIPLAALLLLTPGAFAIPPLEEEDGDRPPCVAGIVCYEITDRGLIANVSAYVPNGNVIAYAEVTLEQGYLDAGRAGSRIFLAQAYDAPDWSSVLNQGGPVTYEKQAELGVYYAVKGPVAQKAGELRERSLRVYDQFGTIATVPLVVFVPSSASAPALPAAPTLDEINQFVF